MKHLSNAILMTRRGRMAGLARSCILLVVIASTSGNLLAQRYTNSIVSTDFDIIRSDDPGCFEKIAFLEKRSAEMPDKTIEDGELFQEAFVFSADFTDGTAVKIFIDAEFGTAEEAEIEARRYTDRLGRLPTILRSGVNRLVVHKGGERATAFSDVGLIVVYSGNATRRIETNDLEETLFHESVHAAWDKKYATSAEWQRAQMSDLGFATLYGKSNPELEDLAESALLAYAAIHHPDRLPDDEIRYLKQQIPNRILFVESLIPAGKPVIYPVAEKEDVKD